MEYRERNIAEIPLKPHSETWRAFRSAGRTWDNAPRPNLWDAVIDASAEKFGLNYATAKRFFIGRCPKRLVMCPARTFRQFQPSKTNFCRVVAMANYNTVQKNLFSCEVIIAFAAIFPTVPAPFPSDASLRGRPPRRRLAAGLRDRPGETPPILPPAFPPS
jgi:hypothetical protein